MTDLPLPDEWEVLPFDPSHEAPEAYDLDPEHLDHESCDGSGDEDGTRSPLLLARSVSLTAANRGWGSGWPNCQYSQIKTLRRADGVVLPVHQRLVALIAWLCDETERRGYNLVPGWCWGFACRAIAGTRTASNHSWGRACLTGDTEVLTWNGPVPIGDLAGDTARLLTRDPFTGKAGQWVDAPVSSFGEQPIQRIVLSRRGKQEVVMATGDHRWFVSRPTTIPRTDRPGYRSAYRVTEVVTDGLEPGDRLITCRSRAETVRTTPSSIGVAHGIMFGDGTLGRTTSGCVDLIGKKRELLRFFPEPHVMAGGRPDAIRVVGLPRGFKALPSLDESSQYLMGWLAGYIATDAHVSTSGVVTLTSAVREHMEFAQVVATRLGIGTSAITTKKRGTDAYAPGIDYQLTFLPGTIGEALFVRSDQRERFVAGDHRSPDAMTWKVESITDAGTAEVFCATVEGTRSFTLFNGVLTGNCDINAPANPMASRLITDMPSWMPVLWESYGFRWGGRYRTRPDCFTGDTMLVTRGGPAPIRDLAGREVELLSTTTDPRTGTIEPEWVKAPVADYGWDRTWAVTLRRRGVTTTVRTTGQHRWFVQAADRSVRFVTTAEMADGALRQGDRIPALTYPEVEPVRLHPEAVASGIVWGDGSLQNKHSTPACEVRLYGPKEALRSWLDPFGTWWGENPMRVRGMPADFKDLPYPDEDLGTIAGFFAGWFACDGHVSTKVPPSLSTSDARAVAWITEVAPRLGLTITSVSVQAAGKSGFGSTKDNHMVVFRDVPDWLLLREDHRDKIVRGRRWFGWQVESVETTGIAERVYCPTVEGRHSVAVHTPSVPVLSGQSMHYEFMGTPLDADRYTRLILGQRPPAPLPPASQEFTVDNEAKAAFAALNKKIDGIAASIPRRAFIWRDPRDGRVWVVSDNGRWHARDQNVLAALFVGGLIPAYEPSNIPVAPDDGRALDAFPIIK